MWHLTTPSFPACRLLDAPDSVPQATRDAVLSEAMGTLARIAVVATGERKRRITAYLSAPAGGAVGPLVKAIGALGPGEEEEPVQVRTLPSSEHIGVWGWTGFSNLLS